MKRQQQEVKKPYMENPPLYYQRIISRSRARRLFGYLLLRLLLRHAWEPEY